MRDAKLWAVMLGQERWWVPASGWRTYVATGSLEAVPERVELARMGLEARIAMCGVLLRNAEYLAWAAGHSGTDRCGPAERWGLLAGEPFVKRLKEMNDHDGIAAVVWPEVVATWFCAQRRDAAWQRVRGWLDAQVLEGVALELGPYAAGVVANGGCDPVAVLLAGGVSGGDVAAVLHGIEAPPDGRDAAGRFGLLLHREGDSRTERGTGGLDRVGFGAELAGNRR